MPHRRGRPTRERAQSACRTFFLTLTLPRKIDHSFSEASANSSSPLTFLLHCFPLFAQWVVEEDEGLARAFVLTTNASPSGDFFPRLYQNFIALSPPPTSSPLDAERWHGRTERALKKRLVVIRPSAVEFSKHYAAAVASGGCTDSRAITSALERFRAAQFNDETKPAAHADNAFKYLHAWRILREAGVYKNHVDATNGVALLPEVGVPAGAMTKVEGEEAVLAAAATPPAPMSVAPDVATQAQHQNPAVVAAAAAAVQAGSGPGAMMATPHRAPVAPMEVAGVFQARSGASPAAAAGTIVQQVLAVNDIGGGGQARKRARDEGSAGTGATAHVVQDKDDGKLVAIGERLCEAAEEIVGIAVFGRPGADEAKAKEFFQALEDKYFKKAKTTTDDGM